MIQTLLYNDLLSLSARTAILEAADWDESIASRISSIIEGTPSSSDLNEAKNNLKKELIKENISKRIIESVFILIDIEEAKMKTLPKIKAFK